MSMQIALVRIALSDGTLVNPGTQLEWEGLNWKVQPTDPAERAEWEENHRDDERVADNRRQFGPYEEMPIEEGCYTPPTALKSPPSGWGV
ncbi:hypothetical protein [Sphingobium indicum]